MFSELMGRTIARAWSLARHSVDGVVAIAASVLFVAASTVTPTMACDAFQRSSGFVYLGWASFAGFLLASVLCLRYRRRARIWAFTGGLVVSAVAGVTLLVEATPDLSLAFPSDGQPTPIYSNLQTLGRHHPASKGVYWLGATFEGMPIAEVDYRDLWDTTASDAERLRPVTITYDQPGAPTEGLRVRVMTYRVKGMGSAVRGVRVVSAETKSGQEVVLRFTGPVPPSEETLNRARAALQRLPQHVGCVE